MNNDKPLCGLSVVFHAAPTFYQLPDYLLEVGTNDCIILSFHINFVFIICKSDNITILEIVNR